MEREFQSGEIVPVSGLYRMKHDPPQAGLRQEITFIRGRRFPAYPNTDRVRFELIYRDELRPRRRSIERSMSNQMPGYRPQPLKKLAAPVVTVRRFFRHLNARSVISFLFWAMPRSKVKAAP